MMMMMTNLGRWKWQMINKRIFKMRSLLEHDLNRCTGRVMFKTLDDFGIFHCCSFLLIQTKSGVLF